MVVSPLWRGPVNIHGFVLDDYLLIITDIQAVSTCFKWLLSLPDLENIVQNQAYLGHVYLKSHFVVHHTQRSPLITSGYAIIRVFAKPNHHTFTLSTYM